MSHSVPSCPKCRQPMQTGFLVDRSYGANVQSTWIAGEAHTAKIFGMSTGSLTIDEKQVHPMTCYRCTVCNYLEFYAYPLQAEEAEEAETMLLRPAQGTSPIQSQQLLRGSSADED